MFAPVIGQQRIPLTIEDANPEAGTITIVVQAIGKTTMLLSMLEAGDSILDVVGNATLGLRPSSGLSRSTCVVGFHRSMNTVR
jgi:ferredoxin--NADP+ reductase